MKRIATISDAGKRADVWLREQVPALSRARICALIEAGFIRVPGRVLKADTKVVKGMEALIAVPPPDESELLPQDLPLAILYEDSDIVVVNKPANLVVHPAAGHASGTLVNALLHHCRDLAGIGGERRPGIVHRLDKDTTGVIVVAKNERALQAMVSQFKTGDIRKVYTAIVLGAPDPPAGTIETLIGRSRMDRKKMSARPRRGREAVTHYTTIEPFPQASLLRVRIETGRTHQIRVHMAHLGHPVLGDRQYSDAGKERKAGASAPRQMLHAARLTLTHPRTGRRMTFKAPLPPDMETVLSQLRH